MKYIHPTVIIWPNVIIEDNVYIGPYTIIGEPSEIRNSKAFLDTPDIGTGVIIKSGAVITGLVSIDTGTIEPTEIGENCFIMKHCHIGHDCKIGNNVTMAVGTSIAGHVVVGDDTTFGLNVSIHQKVVIPGGCMFGASSFIGKKDVLKPNRKYVGIPLRDIGENKKNERL